jgi:hypothetical protein
MEARRCVVGGSLFNDHPVHKVVDVDSIPAHAATGESIPKKFPSCRPDDAIHSDCLARRRYVLLSRVQVGQRTNGRAAAPSRYQCPQGPFRGSHRAALLRA